MKEGLVLEQQVEVQECYIHSSLLVLVTLTEPKCANIPILFNKGHKSPSLFCGSSIWIL